MGREIKRVPLNFSWPLNKVWAGYLLKCCINNCDDCKLAGELMGYKLNDCGCPNYPKFDPPKGDGYQLWETISEGSPITPVFATPEKLAKWLVGNDTSITKDCDYEGWLKFINGPGWAVSGVLTDKGFQSGVAALNND